MKIFILNILLLLISPVFYAQEKEDNVGFTQYSSSVFDSKEKSLSVVSSMMDKKSSDVVLLNNNQPSGVLIQQIGDFNNVTATLNTIETKLSVQQRGDDNDLLLDKTAKTVTQNVVQQGDNNKITDFTLYTNYNVNTEMIQNGDNQSIQNIGTNSISKNMKITQTGNGASVILINK
jgi:hypothetical protein